VNPQLLLSSLPNVITIGRLVAVPVMVWLIVSREMTIAFWLFVAAGVSDGVDGFIAKRFNAESVLGSYLDPLADKVMLVCIYVTLGIEGQIAAWLVILVVFRDGLIVGGTILSELIGPSVRMKPLFISKINTTAQIILAAFVLAQLGLGFEVFGLVGPLQYLVGATTIFSGALYLQQWLSGSGEFIDEKPAASVDAERRPSDSRDIEDRRDA
jgi:cardiolipin synthase